MLRKEDAIGKIFADVACLLEPETTVAIGGEENSGYFYFGKVKNMFIEIEELRDRLLSEVEQNLKTNINEPTIKALNKKKQQLEDFDLLNAKVIDIYNKKQDVDVGIILSDFIPSTYWFEDEFKMKKRFASQGNSINSLYSKYPELIGKFDPVIDCEVIK